MNVNRSILSAIVHHDKYAAFLPDLKRRELWAETAQRYLEMHIRKFPKLEREIRLYGEEIINKRVVPSMRGLQFGGRAIEANNVRLYNCSGHAIDRPAAFAETMYLLLAGCGVGYSVQKKHTERLPKINKRGQSGFYQIADSIEGWAASINEIMAWAFGKADRPVFDYSLIRPQGAPLVTSGGKAPGPEPLRICHEKIMQTLDRTPNQTKLSPILCHDIICILSNAVLAGGVRRSACIALFDIDDEEMMGCKDDFPIVDWEIVSNVGDWITVKVEYVETDSYGREEIWKEFSLGKEEWEGIFKKMAMPFYFFHEQRSRANNSVVMHRNFVDRDRFNKIITKALCSNYGEPGIYWTSSYEALTNPCAEIGFGSFDKSGQFCNLTEVDLSKCKDDEAFFAAIESASFFGTLQAAYTDFRFLGPQWKENTEKEALLGVSLTGIASTKYEEFSLAKGAQLAIDINEYWARQIGINKAARVTTVKPSGTTSLVLGTTSGIHAAHGEYYIRRMRIGKDKPLYKYLMRAHPELVEDEYFSPASMAVISVPIKSDDGARLRDESALEMASRIKYVYENWVRMGHVAGPNTHNVSATISYRPSEIDELASWLWKNRTNYNAISLLPFDEGDYKQAPFETISKEKYEEMSKNLQDIDLSLVLEQEDLSMHNSEPACVGGMCEIISL